MLRRMIQRVLWPSLAMLFCTACTQNSRFTAAAIAEAAPVPPAQVVVQPDHIVIVIMENHSYRDIIGSPDAPYINALLKDSCTANFTRSYGNEHPSQPNYLDLYSGDNQGVTDDYPPRHAPFTTPNLGAQLIAAGKTFITYSEDLPVAGYNGDYYGAYVRKHNPAANWMGTGKNQVPANTNLPFTMFPSDYTKLPTVCFVVPNQLNDMHDGPVEQGDKWVKQHMDRYIQWAKQHNSLFILTFDEEYEDETNHIPTLFCGAMVKGGSYKVVIDHFSILRTIEAMYGLTPIAGAAKAKPITVCWR